MKRFVRTGLLAALLVTGATAAQAQISFGPKVGLNLATFHETLSDNAKAAGDKVSDYKMIVGASFGLMLNARFGNVAVQPALTYSMKGAKWDETFETQTGSSTTTVTARLGYLDIPINVVYTTGGDHGFQVFAGPYVGFGIGGKVSTTGSGSTDVDVKFTGTVKEGDDLADKWPVNTPDFGINAGVGYLVNNFQVQAGYGLGLGNLVPKFDGLEDADRGKLNNRVIHLTFGYLFGGN